MAEYGYFTGSESEQFSFYRVPKVLFTHKEFSEVSRDAKLLYGILLDRMGLSRKNGWLDDDGKIFIIFTRQEIMESMKIGQTYTGELLMELEKAGLIERRRRGMGKPNLIYVRNFTDCLHGELNGLPSDREKDCHCGKQSDGRTGDGTRLPPSDNRGRHGLSSSGNQDCHSRLPPDGNTDCRVTAIKTAAGRHSGVPPHGIQDCRNTACNDTDKSKTDKNDTELSDMVFRNTGGSNAGGERMHREEEKEESRFYGRFENVLLTDRELGILKKDYPKSWQYWIDRLSDYMASTQKTYRNHFATLCLWADKEERVQPVRDYEKSEGLLL